MGCGSCGTGADGKPGGCKGNGGCSTGGCNRLNVYDWLSAIPLHDAAKPYPIVEVSFSKGSRKEFFRNNTHHILEKGYWFAVEGVSGYDVGQVSLTGELVKLQLKKYGVREPEVTKRILHPATEEELEAATKQKEREAEVLIRSRAIARSLNLDMKLCEVEIQADSKKGTFFYTADQRVDFRELIRVYATDFKMKVEMKQIGARQESGKVGGIGSCGRELCCSTWLTDFKSVNTTAARYQNLSINQTKLSGQCGRLKCCLNYELDTYMDALSVFPDHADHLETVKGVAHLQKRDIFKSLMWYSYSDNNKQYPLSIERVKEIQKLNKLGQKADELQPVELETKESRSGKVVDMGYVNDVGTITLKALENKNKKRKSGGNKPHGNKPANAAGGPPQPRGPQQAAGGGQPQRNRGQQGNRQPQQATEGGQPQGNKPQQGNRPQGNRPQGQPKQPQQQRPNQQGQNKPVAEGGAPNPQQARGPRPNRPNRPDRNKGGGEPRPDRPPKPESPKPEA
jgi:cell fate regulator YaaT (PSP1 superfamily)